MNVNESSLTNTIQYNIVFLIISRYNQRKSISNSNDDDDR